ARAHAAQARRKWREVACQQDIETVANHVRVVKRAALVIAKLGDGESQIVELRFDDLRLDSVLETELFTRKRCEISSRRLDETKPILVTLHAQVRPTIVEVMVAGVGGGNGRALQVSMEESFGQARELGIGLLSAARGHARARRRRRGNLWLWT